jgi:hypothetical protein
MQLDNNEWLPVAPKPDILTEASSKVYHDSFCQLGNETLFPNWQKESWQTFEETSGYVRPERVNKWPNCMTDI